MNSDLEGLRVSRFPFIHEEMVDWSSEMACGKCLGTEEVKS